MDNKVVNLESWVEEKQAHFGISFVAGTLNSATVVSIAATPRSRS
jgi:hypothetical protein